MPKHRIIANWEKSADERWDDQPIGYAGCLCGLKVSSTDAASAFNELIFKHEQVAIEKYKKTLTPALIATS